MTCSLCKKTRDVEPECSPKFFGLCRECRKEQIEALLEARKVLQSENKKGNNP